VADKGGVMSLEMSYSQETIDDLIRSVNEQKAKVIRLREALETIRANPFGESWASEYAEEALKDST